MSVRNLGLTAYDDLFSTEEERTAEPKEKISEISLSDIDDFPDHPFQVRDDDAMTEMTDSIRKFGVINPVILRQKDDGRYEIISGHRRRHACQLADIQTIPAIVRDMSRDEAIIFMVDSNLQREQILPSEKAFSYKMRLEAMKRQAGRPNKNNVSPLGTDLRSDSQLAEIVGESRNQIQRYVRLTSLVPEILKMVDENKVAFRPAVEISYLTEKEQKSLIDTMQCEDCTPSLAQAIKMKQFSKDGKLNDEVILSILEEEKPNQKVQFKIPQERISKYFAPGTPAQKIEDTIVKALEMYRKRQRDMER